MPDRDADSPTARSEERLNIDDYLPNPDVSVRRHTVVDADPETTIAAVRTMDFARMGPAVNLLGRLRGLPEELARLRRGEPPRREPERMDLERLAAADEPWTLLANAPTEVVVGSVGKVWRPEIEWADVSPEEFAAFDEPGWAKIAFAFVARPYGSDRTLLTYDVRTRVTDRASRRRFRAYWVVVGPGAAYLMQSALRRAKADAERDADENLTRIPVQSPDAEK